MELTVNLFVKYFPCVCMCACVCACERVSVCGSLPGPRAWLREHLKPVRSGCKDRGGTRTLKLQLLGPLYKWMVSFEFANLLQDFFGSVVLDLISTVDRYYHLTF